MNNKIITSFNDGIYSYAINIGMKESQSGQLYVISTSSQSVPANGFLALQLNNPAKSGRDAYIYLVSGGAAVNTTLDIFSNATYEAEGTTITPQNMNWSYSNSSVMTAKYIAQSNDPTKDGTLVGSIIQIGGTITREYNGLFIIPCGIVNRQFYLRLTNNTNQTNLCSLNVIWMEV